MQKLTHNYKFSVQLKMGDKRFFVTMNAENQTAAYELVQQQYPNAFDIDYAEGIWCSISSSWLLIAFTVLLICFMFCYPFSSNTQQPKGLTTNKR